MKTRNERKNVRGEGGKFKAVVAICKKWCTYLLGYDNILFSDSQRTMEFYIFQPFQDISMKQA
jgi:hypothetical protein